jgi:hypothetical protein
MLHAHMPPETEYFLTHHLLKAIDKTQGDHHRSHADDRGNNGKADDEPGKRMLFVKGNSSGYEIVEVQKSLFS